MKDDDPEKRIRELEKQLEDFGRARPEQPRYPYVGGSSYDSGQVKPRRKVPILLWFPIVLVAIFVLAAAAAVYIANRVSGGGGPIAVPQGGTLGVGGNGENNTIACNDGNLTLSAMNSAFHATGHCAGLTVTGFDNRVSVDNADSIEISGYGNTVTSSGHSVGVKISLYGNHVDVGSAENLTVANYGNTVSVAGHCGTVAVSLYNNQVRVESADTINVSGYSNTVTYRSGTPKVSQSGYDITVKQG